MRVKQSMRNRPSVATWSTIVLVWVVGLGAVGWALALAGPPQRWSAVVVLAALGFLSKAVPPSLLRNEIRLSLSSIVLLTAIPLTGPTGAALVGAISVLGQLPRTRLQAAVFNLAMHVVMGALGGVAYVAAGGVTTLESSQSPLGLLRDIGFPLVVADLVQCLTNAALLAGILRVATGAPYGSRLRFLLGSSGAAYVGYGVLSFLLVMVWLPAGVGAFSTILILPPLLVVRWAYGQYGAELEAHNRTLTALVAAIEIKSPALVGHSAAVSMMCEWIGDELHLPSSDVEAAGTAGMLHDIGLLGLPSAMLRPGHVLTPEEATLLEDHAASAARMLDGISFLDRAVVGVVHHHERFDGSGYPSGLSGERIPIIARIVATADAFVALLAARQDRLALSAPEALAVLQSLGGAAFDPAVVSALSRALSRHETPGLVGQNGLGIIGSAVAHDEPRPTPVATVTPDVIAAPSSVVPR